MSGLLILVAISLQWILCIYIVKIYLKWKRGEMSSQSIGSIRRLGILKFSILFWVVKCCFSIVDIVFMIQIKVNASNELQNSPNTFNQYTSLKMVFDVLYVVGVVHYIVYFWEELLALATGVATRRLQIRYGGVYLLVSSLHYFML